MALRHCTSRPSCSLLFSDSYRCCVVGSESDQLGFVPVIAVDSARKAMEFLGLKGGKVKRPLLASLFTPGFGIMHLSPADAKRNSALL